MMGSVTPWMEELKAGKTEIRAAAWGMLLSAAGAAGAAAFERLVAPRGG